MRSCFRFLKHYRPACIEEVGRNLQAVFVAIAAQKFSSTVACMLILQVTFSAAYIISCCCYCLSRCRVAFVVALNLAIHAASGAFLAFTLPSTESIAFRVYYPG